MIRDPPEADLFPVMAVDIIQDLLDPLPVLRRKSACLSINRISKITDQHEQDIQNDGFHLQSVPVRLLYIEKDQRLEQFTDIQIGFQSVMIQFLP